MKLVIAEKPSVAMSLAAVLGATERKDGYLEGSGYLVSWCVGHLLELAQPEAYKEQYAKWRYEDLPILPENWKYEVPKDKKTQLALLCRLMKDKRVDSVVCATDAGREGELIFRLVYEYAGCNKPMERLWISSMEDAAIREGFDRLRPGSDYDKLYDAAVCRAGADWLIGINATRLFSVLYGVTLNVGRVMSPTLALLVQRESDIESFISKPFYVPEITCGGFTASGEKMTERSEAEKIRMDCDHNSAFVRSAEKQVKTIQPPRLYDLTTLQRECNRIYGYTAQQTLDYVQSLYEKKLATYPRTDSQYLTKDMQATAASLILWLRNNMPFGKGCAGEPDIDRVTDDSKVTDHHAIIPTVEIARTDLSELPSGERDVLTLLAVRLLCATTQANRFEAVTAMLDCQGYTFTAKGKTILQSGWKEVERIHRMSIRQSETERRENEDAALPVLKELKSGNACIVRNPIPMSYGEDVLEFTNIEAGENICVAGMELNVLKTLDGYDGYLGIGNGGFTNGVQVIVDDAIYERLTGKDTYSEFLPTLNEGADREIFDTFIEAFCDRTPGTTFLSYEESDQQLKESFAQIQMLAWGLILFVGLIGILNIINTVYTNIHTRVTEIGMQRAIGMSAGSLYKTFLWEGAYYGIIASVIGSVLGYVCTIFIEAATSDTIQLVAIPVMPILEATLLAVGACLLATAIPLRKISKMNIVDSIETVE